MTIKLGISSERERYLTKFNKEEDIQFLLHDIKDEKPYFKENIHPEHLTSVVCVKPLQNNKRIIRQMGLFLLFGNDKKNKYKPAKLADSGLKIEKVIIDKKSINKIIKQLEITGISKSSIYPYMQEISEYLLFGSNK